MIESLDLTQLLQSALAVCRAAVIDGGPLLGALFLAGLVGGMSHCAGMCGPFVLAQVTADPRLGGGAEMTEFRRLRGALLLPYHLGRATTYGGLGAVAAGLTGRLVDLAELRWLAAALLLLAAAMFLGGSLGLWRQASAGAAGGWLGRTLSRLAAPLLSAPGGLGGYALGLLLGFLPCGLLYAALTAAAAAGSAAQGAAAMAAFALGTAPALVGVGFAGHFFGRRWSRAARLAGGVLMLVNAGILTALAWSVAV